MKKFAISLTSLLLLLPLQLRAEQPLGPVEVTSVDEIAYDIGALFPKVQGEVKSLQGGKLTLNLGRKDGLLPGMVLSLWRDGRELLHPVTKAVLGRAEEEVGTVEVTGVSETAATGVLKSKQKEPRRGDRARISPRQIKLGIIPLGTERPEIAQGLTERLKDLGRFSVLEPQKVDAFLQNNKQRNASLAGNLISAQNLDAAVAVGVYPVGGEKALVMVRLFYSADTDLTNTFVAMLTLASKREALGDVRPFFAPVKSSLEKLPELSISARYFGAGDLDGDGSVEYVFSDESKLHILRPDPAGWKEVWTETISSGDRGARQFHLEVADINNNGISEIYVTRMLNGRVSTSVMEFRDNAFSRVAEIPGFLRTLHLGGRGTVLIGQDYDPGTFYSGPVREYSWTGGTLAAGQEVVLPKVLNLYGFTFADFGEAHPLLVAFDHDGKLAVYSGDTVLWKSEERYLAVNTVVVRPLSGLDAAIGRAANDLDKSTGGAAAVNEREREVHIPGTILAVDLDGDGKDELVLPKNTPAALVGGYKAGEVQSLAWTGSRLEPRWTVKDTGGAVLDLHILAAQGTVAVKVAALIQVSGGLFSKDTFRIERYEGK